MKSCQTASILLPGIWVQGSVSTGKNMEVTISEVMSNSINLVAWYMGTMKCVHRQKHGGNF